MKAVPGLKTGSTSLALYNLCASATRKDLSLIAVVLKGPTSEIRFSEAKKLLDYGFANYSYSGALIKNSETGNITSEVNLNETIAAPITTGDVLRKC